MSEEKKQLSSELKKHIINLYSRNYTIESIADIYQVSKSTIYRIINKYNTTKSVERIKDSGRKFGINKTNKIIKIIEENNNLSTNDISKILLSKHNIKCSKSAVHRNLINNGFIYRTPITKPLLTDEHKNCRENWAIYYQNYNWNEIIWSDECTISIQANVKSKIWINETSDIPVKRIVKHPIKINLWGCILKGHKLVLTIYEKTMNSDKYINILKTYLLALIEENKKDKKLIFQQDNAPCHTSLTSIGFLSENSIEVMYWPPNSPDLNPIENIWHILKIKIGKIIVKNKAELIDIIKEEANKLYINTINKLINSMDNMNYLINLLIQLIINIMGY